MTFMLRLAQLLVCMMFIAWTVVFPLATLLSLVITLPLVLLFAGRPTAPRAAFARR